jgi:hypothetical protein
MTEWGMKFPEEKRQAAKEATKLKRFATVEVSASLALLLRLPYANKHQDVADQVRLLALSKSVTGQNIVIDSGTSL